MLLSPGHGLAQEELRVETLNATSPRALTVSLTRGIHSNGMPTKFYFEYGRKDKKETRQTTIRDVAPRIGAYYYETWAAEMAEMDTRFTNHHIKKPFSKDGYVRFTNLISSGHIDDNHVPMKLLYLLLWRNIGLRDMYQPSMFIGGGKADFRNAEITLRVRGHNYVPNGAEFLWWEQSQLNVATEETEGTWKNANWAYTGFPLNKYLMDGRWHTVKFTLHSDPTKWTYAGNNPAQITYTNPDRYSYMPLGRTLMEQNVNFLLVLAYVERHNPPTGWIDLDFLEIAYGNKSLVFPVNGGVLVDYPVDSFEDPQRLTDGWRHGKGKMWKSAKNPRHPQQFLYRVPKEVKIDTVQIHQHTEFPSKTVEVLVSMDGVNYRSIAFGEMPKAQKGKENYAFFIKRELQETAQYIKVIVGSGYQSTYWGLGEIEIFGEGIDFPTEEDYYYVNRDINDIKEPGDYIYRLVAISGGKKYYGEYKAFKISF